MCVVAFRSMLVMNRVFAIGVFRSYCAKPSRLLYPVSSPVDLTFLVLQVVLLVELFLLVITTVFGCLRSARFVALRETAALTESRYPCDDSPPLVCLFVCSLANADVMCARFSRCIDGCWHSGVCDRYVS